MGRSEMGDKVDVRHPVADGRQSKPSGNRRQNYESIDKRSEVTGIAPIPSMNSLRLNWLLSTRVSRQLFANAKKSTLNRLYPKICS